MSVGGRARRYIANGYLAAIGAATAALVGWAVVASVPFLSAAPGQFWILALIALLVDVPRFAALPGFRIPVASTMAVCVAIAIASLWGLAPGVVVQTVSVVVSAIGQRVRLRVGVSFVCRHVLAMAAAVVVVLEWVVPRSEFMEIVTSRTNREVAVFALMAVTWLAVNLGLFVVGLALLSSYRSFRPPHVARRVRDDLLIVAMSILLAAPLLAIVDGWWSALVVLPLFVWNVLEFVQLFAERRLGRDEVTGLLNRRGLLALIDELTEFDNIRAGRLPPFGLVVLNVEPVSDINRALGRTWSNKVVRELAGRLRPAYGGNAGRLTESGAIVIRPGLTGDDALAKGEYARRLLAEPVTADGVPFDVDPAAGVALSPAHGRSLEELVFHAEQAMNDARRQGLPAKVYEQQVTNASERRAAILSDVYAALQDPERAAREITVRYQPQVDVATGRVCGVEALAGWTNPQTGPVPAEDFFAAIEPSEVIHLMTRHVLDAALRQARAWNTQAFPVRMAVNVSAKNLRHPAFVEDIDAVLRRHGVPAAQLTIEMTERMALDDARIARTADGIAGLGVRLALDDFGTGHTSMQLLRDLPLTELKIDKSYVRRMLDSSADRAIVTSMHDLARALDLDIVAEGVEDERMVEALAEMPIPTIAQGWHFGGPMTPDEFEQWRQETGRAV